MKETLFVSQSKPVVAALSLVVEQLRGDQVFFPVVQRNQTEHEDGLTRICNPGQILGGVNVTDIYAQQDGSVASLTFRSFNPFFVNVTDADYVFHVKEHGHTVEYRNEEIGKVLAEQGNPTFTLYCIIIKERGSFHDE